MSAHLLDGSFTNDMTGALEDREAEASVQLLACDGAHKLCLIAGLEVALGGDTACLVSILNLGEPAPTSMRKCMLLL